MNTLAIANLRFVALLSLLLCFCSAQAQQDPTKDALRRVAKAHDPAIFVATGALYLKQVAIRANNGRPLSQALDREVDELIDVNVRDTAWFSDALAEALDGRLTAEEADEVVSHFATEGGQLQRGLIELAVGEVLTSTYTFTNKIDYQLTPDSREMQDLQRAVGPMRGTCACPTPKERETMRRGADGRPINPQQDLTSYPGAVKFATTGVGVKYVKILMMQGVASISDHFESVAKQIREVVATVKSSAF